MAIKGNVKSIYHISTGNYFSINDNEITDIQVKYFSDGVMIDIIKDKIVYASVILDGNWIIYYKECKDE